MPKIYAKLPVKEDLETKHRLLKQEKNSNNYPLIVLHICSCAPSACETCCANKKPFCAIVYALQIITTPCSPLS